MINLCLTKDYCLTMALRAIATVTTKFPTFRVMNITQLESILPENINFLHKLPDKRLLFGCGIGGCSDSHHRSAHF